jgi:hypothetical protein
MASKHPVLRGLSAWTGLAAVFMIHEFSVLLKTCITICRKIGVSFNSFRAAVALEPPALGDAFSWSFAQKMVPKPCGCGVMFLG